MLRVKMMKAYMLTPFVVNQLINMVIKTGLPKWIHTNLKEEKGNRKGCYLGLCQLLGLILGHGGMRFKSEKCPTLKVELYKMEGWENDNTGGLAAHEHELEVEEIAEMHDEMHDDADHTGLHADREHEKFEKHKRKLKREATKKKIQDRRNRGDPLAHFKEAEVNVEFIMEESILWDFNEFNEQLEICLQFGWIMLFSAVFPLGSTIAMINNTLEMRSDTYKLTNVCKRPGETERAKDGWSEATAKAAYCVLTKLPPTRRFAHRSPSRIQRHRSLGEHLGRYHQGGSRRQRGYNGNQPQRLQPLD